MRGRGESISLTKEDLDLLPDKPGVYIFMDGEGRVIYVGKAASLKKRVRSYFSGADPQNPRLAQLRKKIGNIDYIITENQTEALILESNLIKRYRPDFNINLRDDKSYPYIGITWEDEYPRVTFFRGARRRDTLYFGPYAHAGAARETIETLRKAFAFRSCRKPHPGKSSGSPCLDYHINLCPGPCIGNISKEEYRENILKVRKFLEGGQEEVIEELRRRMREEAVREEYEKAARTRDRVIALERIMQRQQVFSLKEGDQDVVGMAEDELDVCITVLLVRQGKLLGKKEFLFPRLPEEDNARVVEAFLRSYYQTAPSLPREVLLPLKLNEEEEMLFSSWVERLRGNRVRVKTPMRGEKRLLVRKATENAASYLEMSKIKRASDLEWLSEVTGVLMKELNLSRVPYRIECYDISNFGPHAVTGSMVVFEGGFPRRKDYRKFLIKSDALDDVSRMTEVLSRRIRRLKNSPLFDGGSALDPALAMKLTSFQKIPDLILIDGGKPQLGAALKVIKEFGLGEIEVAALAKSLEGIYRPGAGEPIILPRDSKGLYMLQRIRDEAHRFALEYHRSLREKRARKSVLDDVVGIGPMRKRRLIECFGSVERIKRATLEELRSLEFLDERSAINLYRALHGGDDVEVL